MADKPKIIVDEDWKSQVQKEKQAAQQAEAAPAESQPKQEQQSASFDPRNLPTPDLPTLVEFLASHAMVELGFAAPEGQTPTVSLPTAKYFIDLIGVLEEKTRGNTTKEEGDLLEGLLHQLRMAYVARQQAQAQQ